MELSARLLEEVIWGTSVPPPGSGPEKRQAPRVLLSGRVAITPIANGAVGNPVAARLRDISVLGLGISCPIAMEVGDELVAALPRRGGKPLLICCRVGRCQPADASNYVIGATFTRIIPSGRGDNQPAMLRQPALS